MFNAGYSVTLVDGIKGALEVKRASAPPPALGDDPSAAAVSPPPPFSIAAHITHGEGTLARVEKEVALARARDGDGARQRRGARL